MPSSKKAAKAGAGAYAAGKAVRSNEYVQRLVQDPELRENLRNAFVSARKAYGRVNGKGPAKALESKKVQKELKDAAASLTEAADSVCDPHGQVWDTPGLYVFDGSAFPTASGVNPMVTIEALAHMNARALAAKLG